MLKILVAIKRVIDPNVRVRIKSDGSGVDISNVKMSMNPFDEIAVEQAVRMKEDGLVSEILVLSIGPAQSQEVVRAALAMGADRGLVLQTPINPEPLAVAKLIREVVLAEQPDLVIVGKQAIDDDCNQTGQMLAGLLGWPQGTFVSNLKIEGGQIEVKREIDGGSEQLTLTLPAVVTTDLRLNEPRFVGLPNIMKAKRLPLAVRNADELGVDLEPRLKTLAFEEPRARPPGVKLADANALAEQLTQLLGAA